MSEEYRVWKTGEKVEAADPKNFAFPASGEKVLLKARPPISKTMSTD